MNLGFVLSVALLLFVSQNCKGDWPDLGQNATQRSMKKVSKRNPGCDCRSATYKSCKVLDYLYTSKCYPALWKKFFGDEAVAKAIINISFKLATILKQKGTRIEPPLRNMFEALRRVSPAKIKVIILGQDPTPQAGKATGLAFSLKSGEDAREVPAVLNVLLEVALEGWKVDLSDGSLIDWTSEGVLLLNTAFTITQGKAASHLSIWKPFTELLIKYISDNAKPSAWILWGTKAQSFTNSRRVPGGVLIDPTKHKILKGQHPSPRSVTTTGFNGFFAGGYFKCANEFLVSQARGEIDWDLTDETFLEDCP